MVLRLLYKCWNWPVLKRERERGRGEKKSLKVRRRFQEKLAKAQGNEYLLEDCHFTPQAPCGLSTVDQASVVEMQLFDAFSGEAEPQSDRSCLRRSFMPSTMAWCSGIVVCYWTSRCCHVLHWHIVIFGVKVQSRERPILEWRVLFPR